MRKPKRARLKYKKAGAWYGTSEALLARGGVATAAYSETGGYQIRLAKHDGTEYTLEGKSHSVRGAKTMIRKKLEEFGADLDNEVHKPKRKVKR